MSNPTTIVEIKDLIEGIIYGKLVDAGVDKRRAANVSASCAKYTANEIRQAA